MADGDLAPAGCLDRRPRRAAQPAPGALKEAASVISEEETIVTGPTNLSVRTAVEQQQQAEASLQRHLEQLLAAGWRSHTLDAMFLSAADLAAEWQDNEGAQFDRLAEVRDAAVLSYYSRGGINFFKVEYGSPALTQWLQRLETAVHASRLASPPPASIPALFRERAPALSDQFEPLTERQLAELGVQGRSEVQLRQDTLAQLRALPPGEPLTPVRNISGPCCAVPFVPFVPCHAMPLGCAHLLLFLFLKAPSSPCMPAPLQEHAARLQSGRLHEGAVACAIKWRLHPVR